MILRVNVLVNIYIYVIHGSYGKCLFVGEVLLIQLGRKGIEYTKSDDLDEKEELDWTLETYPE